MQRCIKISVILMFICATMATQASASNPRVQMVTSMGTIVIELDPASAPGTVANFLSYVREGFYDNTIFHRVIKSFMIQGGGFTPEMKQKPTHAPIANEADNGLKNDTGTIAMARTSAPHSATSQFFINVKDNAFLNHKAKNSRGWGYCVFGKVIEGMKVVRAIENVKTTARMGYADVPVHPVVIQKMTLVAEKSEK